MQLTIQKSALILLLTMLYSPDAVTQSTESIPLYIDVDTPAVAVARPADGRNFVNLPSLSYQFGIKARCPAGLSPARLSMNVADSRKSIATADISVDDVTTTSLEIPATQIGPIAIAGLCETRETDDVTGGNVESITIRSVLSAQLSLLCESDTTSQIIYASKSLDVTLMCEMPAEPEPASTN